MVKIWFNFIGNLMDDSETLSFLLEQADSATVEEVTGAMLAKMVADVRGLAAIFCKYSGYAAIALAHTCYILKHYSPPAVAVATSTEPGAAAAAAASGMPPLPAADSYLPPERVKGASHEARV